MKLSSLIKFPKDSLSEVRKMVWPSRSTTLSTLGYIVVFTTLVSVLIWGYDKFLEWAIFDILLQWKKL